MSQHDLELEHRPIPGHGSTWLSPRPMAGPVSQRKLPNPGHCPLCAQERPRLQTAGQLLAHLRNSHCQGSKLGPPQRHQFANLNRYLSKIGYWHCGFHDRYIGSKVCGPAENGLYVFSYSKCPKCTVNTAPRDYVPPHDTQLKSPATNSSSIPALAPDDPAPSAPVTNPSRCTPADSAAAPLQHPAQSLPTMEKLFTTHTPVMSHIPTKFRGCLAETYARAMNEAAQACQSGDSCATHAFAKLFLFPAVMLTPLSYSDSTTESRSQSIADKMRERMELWNQGKFETLWETAVQQSTSRARATSAWDQKQLNIRRATKLAKEGAFGKAAQALLSLGVLPPTPGVIQALLAKHPQEPPQSETWDNALLENVPPFRAFTEDEVLGAVRGFKPGSSAGGSGLKPSHLVELLRSPSSSGQSGFLQALTRVVNTLATGKAPTALAPWIAGAPLTPLAKKDNTPRPIAVGETLRRLVGSCLMKRVSQTAADYLQPLQVGIATRSGTDTVVHGVRRVVQQYGTAAEYGLLTVDLKNAFNLCSRSAFLTAIRNLFPQLLPWVSYCYAKEPAYLWVGSDMIRSVQGTQQGDNLGGLLFDLVLHPIAQKIQELLRSDNEDDEEVGNLLLQLWYHDDGYIIARHEQLIKVVEILSSLDATGRGLHLSLPKCKVWWPTAPPQSVQRDYPREFQQEYSEGTLVLNAPVGSGEFMKRYFTSHVESLKPFLETLVDLEDKQVAFQLLRNCFGVCKISYLLRVVPPSCTSEGAEIFDAMMETCVRTLAGGVLDPDVFKEFQLPVQSQDVKKPSLGLGLTSAKNVAAASFLASSSSSQKLCNALLPAPIKALRTYADALDAHRAWSTSCSQSKVIAFSVFCSNNTPSQKILTNAIHEAVQEQIPAGDNRRQAFRASMALPGAKKWVYCAPCPGLKTHIEPRAFSLWLQYYSQVPLFAPNTPCPRRTCPDTVDIFGDHLLHCPHGRERILRHDSQVTVLATDLARAARHPVVEPRDGQHRTRPDIRAMGRTGRTDFFDVTFVNPLAPSHRRVRAFNPLTSLNAARIAKHRKYESFIATTAGSRLVPVPISTLGGWHPDAYAVISDVARNVAVRALETYGRVRDVLMQRHAAAAVASNAACLMAGLASVF